MGQKPEFRKPPSRDATKKCEELTALNDKSAAAFAEYLQFRDVLTMTPKEKSDAYNAAKDALSAAEKRLKHLQRLWQAHRSEHHCG